VKKIGVIGPHPALVPVPSEQVVPKPSNVIRAAWAASTLEAFKLVSHAGMVDDQMLLSDLLADLMHLCHRNEGKLEFEKVLRRAQINFLAEELKAEG